MGLWDLFKKGPSASGIEAQVRRAKERYAQPDYRRMAMDKLLKWDTKESLKGLLERFCVVVQSPHWDEEEKVWLKEQYIALGEKAEPILREFILEKNDINYALEAYRAITGQQRYQQLLIDCLKNRPPSDHRTVQGKTEIVAALQNVEDLNLDDILLPYLEDHSDDVQCAAIGILSRSKDPHTQEALLKLLKSETHSARVIRMAAAVIAEHKIVVKSEEGLNEAVKESYTVKSGILVPISV